MAQQLKAERRRRADVLEAEGSKKASILKAEGGKRAEVLEAEGEANARRKKADAKRYEYITEAEGEANAIQGIFGAYHKGKPNKEILTLKSYEAMKELADGRASKLIVPSGTADVLGAVSSIMGFPTRTAFRTTEEGEYDEEAAEDLVEDLSDKAEEARTEFEKRAEEIEKQAQERAEEELEEGGA